MNLVELAGDLSDRSQSRMPWWPTTKSASPWVQRTRTWATGAIGAEARASDGVHIKTEIQSELDRRSATQDKGKGAKNDAQGEV